MRRPHLPSMLLGAVLGTTTLAAAAPGRALFADADAQVASVQAETRTLWALTQTLPRHTAQPFRQSLARLDASTQALDASLDVLAQETRALRQDARSTAQALAELQAPPPVVPVMAPAELQRALRAMDRAAFDKDKLALLGDILASGPWVTVDQAIALVRTVTFDGAQVDAAAMLYPHVVDSQDWYRIYDVLTFSSSKDDLRRRTTGG